MASAPGRGLRDLEGAIAGIGVHDHLCLIYETPQEQFSAAMPFMRIGLDRGERCIYIADDNTAATVIDGMKAAGVDVDAAVAAGRLTIASKREAYLQQGYFDPDWMIRFLGQATEEAKAAGFAALRVTGEMTWVLGGDPGTERLMEYEAKLNYFFPHNDALAICQYRRDRFSPDILKGVISTHPRVICGGLVCANQYYVPPDEFLGEQRAAREVDRLLTNIVSRQRVAEYLEERTAELEAANRELESYSYSISHDLRAPLRHIDGYLTLLRARIGAALDEESRRHMDAVSNAARRMNALIEDFLSFCRIRRTEMATGPVELNALVQEILRELEPDLAGRSVHWDVAALPAVVGDRAMLRLALVNLLSNALKYTRARPRAEIAVGSVAGQGSEAIVFVRDNGVGFDMKYANQLFGVFRRLHRMEEYEGTGIGLANVRRIIARHGGRTWAEGKLDVGATFWFSLPLPSGEGQPGPGRDAGSPGAGSSAPA